MTVFLLQNAQETLAMLSYSSGLVPRSYLSVFVTSCAAPVLHTLYADKNGIQETILNQTE